MITILFIFGTRPEAIKMAPLVLELSKHPDYFKVKVCLTAQHREMLDQVTEFFSLKADFDLNLMKIGQTLFDITVLGLKKLEAIFDEVQPDLVFVQGDTTTAFIGALAAHYKKIKIAHLEAGLRSGNKFSPFPEEMNRTMVGHLADLHFAPTEAAKQNLIKEGIRDNIHIVGNTVIDALFLGLDLIEKKSILDYKTFFSFLDFSNKILLVTGHRRESFGAPFENICRALKTISEKFPDTEIVYPVHLNPNVQKPVKAILGNLKKVHLIEPLDYPKLLWLMKKSYLVLTDSGGIQEEAPSLGKPVLVMRNVTEREEGVAAGTAKLVGTDSEVIFKEASILLTDKSRYEEMAKAVNPYGDGTASKKITEVLKKFLLQNSSI